MAMRASPTSLVGLSPHYLLFGREPSLKSHKFAKLEIASLEEVKRVRRNLEWARRVTAREWKKVLSRNTKEKKEGEYDIYEVGDLVNITNHQRSKLQPPLVGPFTVVGHDHRGYQLQNPLFNTMFRHPRDMFRIETHKFPLDIEDYPEEVTEEEKLSEEVTERKVLPEDKKGEEKKVLPEDKKGEEKVDGPTRLRRKQKRPCYRTKRKYRSRKV